MNKFEEKMKPLLSYIGFIGSVLMSIAYIFAVIVMIRGFKVQTATNTFLFAGVNAGVGLLISNFLKYQGISLAKNLQQNKELRTKYCSTKTKDKKPHSLTFFWVTSVMKDILVKGVCFVMTTAGVIYIVIQGSNDWNLLILAGVNLLMFICFGLLALNKGYDYYNEIYVPYMNEKLKEADDERQAEYEPRADSTMAGRCS